MAWFSQELAGVDITKVYDPIIAGGSGYEYPIGKTCRAVDPTYGEGEFIFLQGVAGTVADDAVVFDPKAKTTTRAVAASKGPLAIARAAIVASKAGWYQIRGACPVNSAVAVVGAAPYVSAATGTLISTVVANTGVDGAAFLSVAGGGKADVNLQYPSVGVL